MLKGRPFFERDLQVGAVNHVDHPCERGVVLRDTDVPQGASEQDTTTP